MKRRSLSTVMSESDSLYLDHNATTPPSPEVIELVARLMRESWANPGSRHAAGRKARRVLEDSRESLAAILGADPDEVIFTSGGTESNNLALRGLVRSSPGLIVSGPGEHPSTAETIKGLQLLGYSWRELAVDPEGMIREIPEQLPWPEIRLLTMLLAHNETGVIQNPQPWTDKCEAERIPFHLDGVQAVGKIDVDFHGVGATSLSFAAHKFHGPRGIGGLLLRTGARLNPLLFGGHQEQARRPGTESVPLIAGMAKALELWQADRERRHAHLLKLRRRLESGLRNLLPSTEVVAESSPRLPNTATIIFPGLDGEALLVALDLAGIHCSLGSTCASGSAEPAPILVAMGLPADRQRSAIRFSLGSRQTEAEIDEAIRGITSVVERQRAAAK